MTDPHPRRSPRRTIRLRPYHPGLVLGVLLGVVGILVLAWWNRPAQAPPRFDGRSPIEWARQLDHANPAIRSHAAAVLTRIGPAAVPFLEQALHHHDSWFQRRLLRWGPRLPGPLRSWTFRTFRPFDAAHDRQAAISGLSLFGTNVPPAILGAALTDPDHRTAGLAAEALARLGPRAVPELARYLDHRETGARSMACYGLTLVGPAAAPAVPDLIRRVANDQTTIQAQALEALVNIGRDAVPGLVRAAADDNPPTRIAVIRAVNHLGSQAHGAREALLQAAREQDPEVRAKALEALGHSWFWSPDTVLVLSAALDDPNPRLRANAADALSRLGPRSVPETIPLLERHLDDPDPAARSNILQALRRIRPPADLKPGPTIH